MNNNIWGPSLWHKLHTKSYNYPSNPQEKDKENIYLYFSELGKNIPCDVCKYHYKMNLINKPIIKCLDCKDDLIKWVIDLHNSVNKQLNKPQLNYNQAMKEYKKNCTSFYKNKNNNSDTNNKYTEKCQKPIQITINKYQNDCKNKNYLDGNNKYIIISLIIIKIILFIFMFRKQINIFW